MLAVTFTNKAAREMSTRLSILTPVNIRGMWIGTFHGLCNRMLRAHYREAGLPKLFQIMDMQDQLALIKRVYKAHNIDDERFPSRQLQALINGSKEEGLRPNQVEAFDEFSRRQVEHYALYEQACQREGVVDFPSYCCEPTSSFRATHSLREHYRRRFSHILIDEFQDTNALQYKWLKLLAGTHAAIFAVGDDDQSIYAFRGANVANMQHFERDFSTAGRSGQAYQARAELPFSRAHTRCGECADQAQPGTPGQEPLDFGRAWRAGAGLRCALRLSTRRRSSSTWSRAWSRMTCRLRRLRVLYRSNAQSRVVEHALFNAAMPYRVYGGMRFFERAEVKHALAYLRLIAAPDDDGAFLRVVNFPPRGIGARSLETLQERAQAQGDEPVAGGVQPRRSRARRAPASRHFSRSSGP